MSMLCEGASVRGVVRMTGRNKETVTKLSLRIGNACENLMDEMFRNLKCERIEIDELWGFIGKKRATVKKQKRKAKANEGDVWTHIAIDPDSKLIPSYHVGQRELDDLEILMCDIAKRMNGRIQLSSDAAVSYRRAIRNSFGQEIDYGQVIKIYSSKDLEGRRRYSPADIRGIKKGVVVGCPDEAKISTSYVEKHNHTLRMHCRRLSRLTNAFSKKIENLTAAVSLYLCYYNMCKVHSTIRCTPAMEAGVTNSIWTVEELVERVDGGF